MSTIYLNWLHNKLDTTSVKLISYKWSGTLELKLEKAQRRREDLVLHAHTGLRS